jgi:hypothetical protein
MRPGAQPALTSPACTLLLLLLSAAVIASSKAALFFIDLSFCSERSSPCGAAACTARKLELLPLLLLLL